MGWIVAGNVTPSFIEGNAMTEEASPISVLLLPTAFNMLKNDNNNF